MCGIAGMMSTRPEGPGSQVLDAMAAALAHRGPDGRGDYRSGNLGMVQTRLAIIDLETGDQPIHEPQGAALIANAEIYNYVELRPQITGVNFTTASDCEPPLHLFRRHGLDFAHHLRGMYAIAIHDPADGRLVLARDPFGIKPLYYAEAPHGFIFASEPHAMFPALGGTPRISRTARDELLQLQFTTGSETMFEGIKRVLPGETLVVNDGRVIERRRYSVLDDGPPEASTEEDALERLDAALSDSVMVHQRSDVPYGMFLSGGIDSSAVLALMARLNHRPVRAFTIGFPETDVPDERAHARAVAAAVGAEHVEVTFEEADFWSLLPQVAAALDDPCADYATVPTFKLARKAGEELKVILSGEGGDEMFAGYGRYRSVMRPWWRGGRAMRVRGIFDRLDVLREDTPAWRDGVHAAEVTESKPGRSRLQIAQATDCADWLPNDLLTKLDRCLMAHSVEGRTPFLDPAVAAAVFRLPDRLKVSGGMGKMILRRWLARALPAAEPFSRKRGFTVPVGEWILSRAETLGPLVAAQPGVAEIARRDAVIELFQTAGKRTGFAAWTLLFYALWHRRHVQGRMPEGDVFDVLGDGAH
ncbi:MAG: asparagine synthase (glutamine-hydrolyzing) [Alphaproteobacteria bacterium]|nr:asparagine synthase (glutamine-hydrolyzing) [Alphaproteobacteria bacterium]